MIGAGASAFDNAAAALEAGATVDLLCRRDSPQVVQPYRWLTFAGFLRHLSDLDDAWRWRFMRAVLSMREGFPQATWDRCARHAGFVLREGAPVLDARATPAGIVLDTPGGPIEVPISWSRRPGSRPISRPGPSSPASPATSRPGRTATVRPPARRTNGSDACPYLAPDYAFTEREPGLTPWTADIHLFAIASTMSFGPSGSSINAMTTAVPKLVSGLTRGLFKADLGRHWASFQAYRVPQAVLRRPDDLPLRPAAASGQTGTGIASP